MYILPNSGLELDLNLPSNLELEQLSNSGLEPDLDIASVLEEGLDLTSPPSSLVLELGLLSRPKRDPGLLEDWTGEGPLDLGMREVLEAGV